MPKTFQFGRRKRYVKARGLSIVHKRQKQQECREPCDERDNTGSSLAQHLDAITTESNEPCDVASTSTAQVDTTTNTSTTTTRFESKLAAYNLLDMNNDAHSSGGHFHIIHSSFLQSLVASFICPSCLESSLCIEESTKLGLAVKFVVSCNNCKSEMWSNFTSPMGPKRFDINNRVVLSSKENGIGYNKLVSFFAHMNISSPMHRTTYLDISKDVHKAATDAADHVMNQAAAVIQERYSCGAIIPDRSSTTGCPVTTISFDGTWQKRGHSSHNGVGVAIDVDTGLVVDTHTVSNFCGACERGPKEGNENYSSWITDHKSVCQKNSNCSSNAMEVVAAEEIFNRSVRLRGLIYGNMLCDGDSKSFSRVKDTVGYDVQVIKMDCINHIAKRMFNALDNVKKTNKSALNRKLTRPMIDKITNVYAKNLKDNAPNVEEMKNGVVGGILHMCSTDEKPNHRHCPVGESSWCGFQRALAKNEQPPPHKPTFKPEVLPYVWPTVKRLTDPELLKRCSRMQTQNANESFNSLIWRRCPKEIFASRTGVETAVALSVLAFNCGASGVKLVMNRLGLRWEKICDSHATATVLGKISRTKNRTVGLSKWKRKNRKSQRLAIEHARETTEGATYDSGAFNS